MDPSELHSGEQTPPRGSSAASIERRKRAEDDKYSTAGKLIETLRKSERDDDGNADAVDDDDSFITMEEIKDSSDPQTASARATDYLGFYSNLSNGEETPQVWNKNNISAKAAVDSAIASTTKLAQSVSRHFSRELLRRRSSVAEALPETPAGLTVLLSALSSAILGYELRLQKSLSCPPLVFGQCGPKMSSPSAGRASPVLLPLQAIYQRLSATPESILSRPITPSLFVGTRGSLASTAAYAMLGPPQTNFTFRQVLTMSADGAKIGLDWELPPTNDFATAATTSTLDGKHNNAEARQKQAQSSGGIHQPLVLVLTGMNNDTSFGYVRALMRSFTDRGWMAVSMNFRGCGKVPLSTPRCYNGGYTGDLRSVVQYLESRLAKDVPLFLVGNSLSANLVTKYLGEEGLSESLPKCIAGGVCLGNPLLMHVNNLKAPWKELLALGVKKDVLLNMPSFRHMIGVPSFRSSIINVLKAKDIGQVDAALAPIFVRNESHYPFAVKIGFDNAEHYWSDSSSFNYIKHISVPCLQIVASDDVICYKSFQKKLAHCIQNPNVMCLETKCGGHLGWQESNPDSNAFGVGASWADRATADFFEAIIETGAIHQPPIISSKGGISHAPPPPDGGRKASFGEPIQIWSKL